MMEKLEAREAQLRYDATTQSRTFQHQSDAAQHVRWSLDFQMGCPAGDVMPSLPGFTAAFFAAFTIGLGFPRTQRSRPERTQG
jgi:hypothetical protein